MSTKRRLLEYVVEKYDDQSRPVSVETLSDEDWSNGNGLEEHLTSLEECGLIEEADDRAYRPTVTAREFLALDVDPDQFVIIDIDTG